jgi:hypothetical protein
MLLHERNDMLCCWAVSDANFRFSADAMPGRARSAHGAVRPGIPRLAQQLTSGKTLIGNALPLRMFPGVACRAFSGESCGADPKRAVFAVGHIDGLA